MLTLLFGGLITTIVIVSGWVAVLSFCGGLGVGLLILVALRLIFPNK
jgi:hypothetical protein